LGAQSHERNNRQQHCHQGTVSNSSMDFGISDRSLQCAILGIRSNLKRWERTMELCPHCRPAFEKID
jgi:hypothetical protein